MILSLVDASTNNAVIECIARATPLLVNPHPAVIEYFGADYPTYNESIDDVALLCGSVRIGQYLSVAVRMR
jgi:hypothetical protein